SKGALNTMTQSLARALAPLIRVNTVCPGYIDTPWFTKGRGEAGAKAVRDAVVAKVPLKVASTADDIAQLVCFLVSPASSNMTGEFIRMDAGMHLVLWGHRIVARMERSAIRETASTRNTVPDFAALHPGYTLDGRRHCAIGMLPGLACIEQHDRRVRPDGC